MNVSETLMDVKHAVELNGYFPIRARRQDKTRQDSSPPSPRVFDGNYYASEY